MQPTVQSLDQIIASLNPAYDPSRALYNQQIQTLPGAEDTAIKGLDAAKVNSFRDINTSANSKGLAFSGIPSEEQARYLGEKYLPAVANVKAGTQKQTFALQQALAGLDQEQRLKATDTQNQQQQALNAYLEEIRKEQFQAQQAALDRQSQGGSGGLTAYQAAELANKAASQYKVSQFKSGNYSFTGPNNAPISMFQYAQATGNNMLDLLRSSGSAYDRQAYNDAQTWIKQHGEDFALQKLQQHYSKLF